MFEIDYSSILRRALPLVALACVGLATPALAGPLDELSGRLALMEYQADRISAATGAPVPPAEVPDASAPAAPMVVAQSSGSVADLTVRMNRLEEQLRLITGQFEETNFQIRRLQDQLQRMQEDNEFRFQDLEKGSGKKRSDAAPAQPAEPAKETAAAAPAGGPAAGPQTLGQVPDIAATDETPADAPGRPLDLSTLILQSGALEEPVENGVPGVASHEFAAAGPSSPRADYDAAYGNILRGDYGAAEASFRGFIDHYPNDPLTADAQYWLGESLYGQGRYRDAANTFLAHYKTYPDSRKVPDSLLKLAASLGALGETSTACATYGKLLNDYPDASAAVRQRALADQKKYHC